MSPTLAEITTLLQVVGFPIWAGIVLWVIIGIARRLRSALDELRDRDITLQQSLDAHIARSDTRVALIEQLLARHDASLDRLWQRQHE